MSAGDLSRYCLPPGPFDDALGMLDRAGTPASRADLSKAIARVAAACRSQRADEYEARAWMAVMLDVLGCYPGPEILDALHQWPHRSKWIPAPAEIVELAREIGSWRGNLTYALKSSRFQHQTAS